jgi:Flp pilus assembly protein TadD
MNLRILVLAPLLLLLRRLGQGDSLQRGLELFRQEKYEAALEQFEAARRLRPADASLENFIGITETNSAASTRPTKITKPPSASTPGSRARIRTWHLITSAKGQYELAEKHLKTALALDSADPFVHYYSAILYLDTSRDQEAMVHIKPAESLLANDQIAALMAIKACLQIECS